MSVNTKICKFWNERAENHNKTAGGNDFILKEIEQNFILNQIKEGSRVLDIGCGNGQSLLRCAKEKNISGLGVDFCNGMIKLAKENLAKSGIKNVSFAQHAMPPADTSWGKFDFVYTERCLINLSSVEEQKEAVLSIANVLESGGLYIMVEGSIDGSKKTNEVRESLGLEPINPPWHNLFFKESDVASWATEDFYVEDMLHISSTYNFLSRIVYAQLAKDKKEELKYDSDINMLSKKLPPMVGDFGPVKAWLWRKK